MSDRIAVFNAGRIEQLGTPREIYERPSSTFVAGFVGVTNLFSGDTAMRLIGTPGTFTIRPERVDLVGAHENGFSATVSAVQYLGPVVHVFCDLDDGGKVVSSVASGSSMQLGLGQRLRVAWPSDAAVRID